MTVFQFSCHDGSNVNAGKRTDESKSCIAWNTHHKFEYRMKQYTGSIQGTEFLAYIDDTAKENYNGCNIQCLEKTIFGSGSGLSEKIQTIRNFSKGAREIGEIKCF